MILRRLWERDLFPLQYCCAPESVEYAPYASTVTTESNKTTRTDSFAFASVDHAHHYPPQRVPEF